MTQRFNRIVSKILGTFGSDSRKMTKARREEARAEELCSGLENLENRQLMSVSMNSAGWTQIGASPDTRAIYVSSSSGNDNNSGLSAAQPVKSIAKGESLLRNGSPDWLLLKRGDTFNETFGQWNLSGRSAAEPMLISSYGATAAARPVVNVPGSQNGITLGKNGANHVAIVGLQFVSADRIPGVSANLNHGANAGIAWVGNADDLLVEDTLARNFGTNIITQGYNGTINNVKIRRSEFLDAWNTSGHSHGLYADNVNGLDVEESVFDHNGWSAAKQPDIFNHNLYIQIHNNGVVLKNNILTRGSSTGAMVRSGGTVSGNLVADNPIGLTMGWVAGSEGPRPGGVTGSITNNTILDGGDIDAANPRGWGILMGNINDSGAVVSNNVVAHSTSNGSNEMAFNLDSTNGMGIHNLQLTNNTVYGWQGGIARSGGNFAGGTDQGNVVNAAGSAYADPNRSLASYAATHGMGNSFDGFMNHVRDMSKANWSTAFMAPSVAQYVRAGFGK